MAEILELTFLRPPGTKPLESADVQFFALASSWTLPEAVMLSLGYHPCKNVEGADIEAIGLSARDRWALLDRASSSGEISFTMQRRSLTDETLVPCYKPSDFMRWLHGRNLSYPQELYDKVIGKPIQDVRSTHNSVQNKDKTNKSEYHSKIGKQKGQLVRDFVESIKTYALSEIERGCTCSHIELADYISKLKQGPSPLFPDPRPPRKRTVPLRNYFIKATANAHRDLNLTLIGIAGSVKTRCTLHPRKK